MVNNVIDILFLFISLRYIPMIGIAFDQRQARKVIC